MKIKGKILFNYTNERDAKVAYDCLEVDNEGYLKSELKGEQIQYTMENDNIGSFLRTADDLISSEIVVEKIIKNTDNDQI